MLHLKIVPKYLTNVHSCFFGVTCPGEGRDSSKGKGSVEASRQRRGGGLAFARAVLATDEPGEVGGWGGDEGVSRVRSVKRRLAAEGLSCSAACKVSATQEQRNGLLPENKIKIKLLNKDTFISFIFFAIILPLQNWIQRRMTKQRSDDIGFWIGLDWNAFA